MLVSGLFGVCCVLFCGFNAFADTSTVYTQNMNRNQLVGSPPAGQKIIGSYSFSAPSIAQMGIIDKPFDYCSLSDIGYSNYDTVQSYDFVGDNVKVDNKIEWANYYRRDCLGIGNPYSWLSNEKRIIYQFPVASGSPSKILLGLDDNRIMLGGQKYRISIRLGLHNIVNPDVHIFSGDGVNWGSTRLVRVPDKQNVYVAEADFTPNQALSMYGMLFQFTGMSYSDISERSYIQLQSIQITPLSNDDSANVKDAIDKNTADMNANHQEQMQNDNKNHQETIDKMDEATDLTPDQSGQLDNSLNDAQTQLNEKMGVITFFETVLKRILGIFSLDSLKEPVLTFPSASIDVEGVKYSLWESHSINLWSYFGKDSSFGFLYTVYQSIAAFIIYSWLIHYMQSIYHKIIGS